MSKLNLCITKEELIDHYLIRKTVFIDEQAISYEEEYDFLEKEHLPFLFIHEDIPIGAARIKTEANCAKFERICILKPYRGLGLGRVLIEEMEKYSQKLGSKYFLLGAQAYAVPFYEKCGFYVIGELYYEAGIPHYQMRKDETRG
ncbi:MAG: GNAT family N-acetyltransferase [Bacilli bacterium]|nr:GNAT family N-acetyltransferase [Bacilli bacterium]